MIPINFNPHRAEDNYLTPWILGRDSCTECVPGDAYGYAFFGPFDAACPELTTVTSDGEVTGPTTWSITCDEADSDISKRFS